MGKARLEMNFYPDDRENYEVVETSIEINDDLDVNEMFNIWKRQMSALGYFMDDYEISRDGKSIDKEDWIDRLTKVIYSGKMPMDNPMPPDDVPEQYNTGSPVVHPGVTISSESKE